MSSASSSDSATATATTDAASTDESIDELEVSSKLVHIGPDCSLTIQFKDFYIIRAGTCDFTGGYLTTDHCVCELGAGVGLSGLVASKFAGHVILTDRVPVLIDLMNQNIRLNHLENKASVYSLDWSIEGARKLIKQYSSASALSLVTSDSAASSSLPSSTSSSTSDAKFTWSLSSACIIAADVVYPDTSDAALIALFDTVDTLLDHHQSNDSISRPHYSKHGISRPDQPLLASIPSLAELPPLTGSLLLSYFSRDSDTTKRLLLAAAAAHYQPIPIDQQLFDPDYQPSNQGLQGIVMCLRKVNKIHYVADPTISNQYQSTSLSTHPLASNSTEPTPVDDVSSPIGVDSTYAPPLSLPSFMYHPSLLRLWQPPPSQAELDMEELHQANEETAFSGLNLDESEDDEEAT